MKSVDQATKSFVAQIKQTGVVRTVIKDVTDKYINNLKK